MSGCVKIFLVRPSVRHIPKNLKRRSPFIFFYVGWEVPRGVFFVINLVRFRHGVRPVSRFKFLCVVRLFVPRKRFSLALFV